MNLAERLGYGRDERLLILHADDAGMCRSANAATIRALTEGVVSSASVMVPCPWFPELAAWAKGNTGADLGVHLTLTSEWTGYRWGPVAPLARGGGLCDEHGYMWRSVKDVVRHASATEVEVEMRAQVESALRFGLRPTHLDSHMGTVFAHPDFFAAYVRVGEAYDIPLMLPTPTLQQRESGPGRILVRRMPDLQRHGHLFIDRLVLSAEGESYEARRESLYGLIKGIEPGVTQIIVHLIGDDEEARAITGAWRRRYHESQLCLESGTKECIEREGITMIGYRSLKERAA